MPAGSGPVLTGAATVFFAVFGYDAMSAAAEEAEDGEQHMPEAIISSSCSCGGRPGCVSGAGC